MSLQYDVGPTMSFEHGVVQVYFFLFSKQGTLFLRVITKQKGIKKICI